VRRYYQCRADIGGKALRNGEFKVWRLPRDFFYVCRSIYDNLKKYLGLLCARPLTSLSSAWLGVA
jgi:hypothetical protein